MSHLHEDQVISVQSYFVKKRELKRPVKWGFLVTPGFSYHDGPRPGIVPAEPGEAKEAAAETADRAEFFRGAFCFL